jgi:hypothetical protein
LSIPKVRPAALLLLSALACLIPSPACGETGEIPSWQPPKTGLGYEVDLDLPASQRPSPIRSREVESRGLQPLYARVRFSWNRVEPQPGIFHFDEVEAAVSDYMAAGFEVILDPRGGNEIYGHRELPLPDQAEYLSAWKKFLRRVGESFRGRVRFYQIGDDPDLPGTLAPGAGAREYAFLLKQGAVEMRGADPDARIVLGSVGMDHLDFLEEVLKEDLGPYLDAVPIRGEAGRDPGPPLERAATLILGHAPAASLWTVEQGLPEPPRIPASPADGAPALPEAASPAHEGEGGVAPAPSSTVASNTPPAEASPALPSATPGEADSSERGDALLRAYVSALTAGSRLVLFDLRKGDHDSPELASLCVLLRRLFLPTLGPSPEGTGRIRLLSLPGEAPLSAAAWKFFDASTFQVILAYLPGETPPASAQGILVLDTPDVTGAVVDDLLANTERPVTAMVPDAATGTTRVTVPLAGYPLLLRYQRFATPGFLKKPESVQVGGKREMTAEEIIAHHQEFQADQDSRLKNIRATARIRYVYRVASADISVDVTTVNNFYWDPKVGGEWEQTEFLFNGVRWTGKKLPDLPLIQPEKVVVLPLNINLNKDYSYRLAGTDTVEGRDCYVLEFTPVTASKSLYQGKVWIDRKSFARVRIASVQTGLGPPVTSNDEKDTYGPAPGSGEAPLWVLQRIGGQQIWNISGVNLVVQREVEFSDFALNSPDFEAKRRAAYESPNVMLRDTDKGFRYLDRDKSGERVLREGETKRTILGAAGVFYEQDLDYPLPLAGVDYFDFNFLNSGSQVNVFFAGALLQASIQDPRLFGSRLDAGASLLGIAFTSNDNFYLGDQKLEQEEVRERTQSASVNLGIPLGNFFKLKLLGFWDYQEFSAGKNTETFQVPVDTSETGYGLQGEFDRWGITVQADMEKYRRDHWEPWGDEDPASVAVGTRLIDFDPGQRSYTTSGALISKQFVLPLFQKVTLRAQVLAGDNQDRFSKYTFGFFGNRVRGFSGSGVRFDRALQTSAGYSFNLAEVLRIEATLDWARVQDTTLSELPPPLPPASSGICLGCVQNFGGFGLSGNVMGPWSTLVRFDWGIAVKSDIPGLQGKQEISLAFLKFF